MKKNSMKRMLALGVLCAGMAIVSCRGNSNESEAAADASEANGTSSGTEAPAANEDSGSMNTTDEGAGMATDTVQGTTTNGNSSMNNGTGTNNGSGSTTGTGRSTGSGSPSGSGSGSGQRGM